MEYGNYPKNFNPSNKKLIVDIMPPPRETGSVKIKQTGQKANKVDIMSVVLSRDKKTDDIGRMWQNIGHSIRRKAPSLKKHPRLVFKPGLKIIVPGFVLIVAALLIFSADSGARILIEPERQEFNVVFGITADTGTSSVDTQAGIIPGQNFNVQKSVEGQFSTTGQKEVAQKAGGTLTIFNTTRLPQALVATTRFESPGGLIFRIPQSITVPAATEIEGELVPGSTSSEVYADKAGEEYNIGPARFTIPGFEGSSKFTEFHATSDAPMAGGIIGLAKVITEQDLLNAQTELSERVRKELQNSLKDRIGNLKTIQETNIVIDDPETDVEAGFAADTFIMKISGTAYNIAFREEDIIDLAEQRNFTDRNLMLLRNETDIGYSDVEISDDGSESVFSAAVSGYAVYKINPGVVADDIIGMSMPDAENYFQNFEGVKKVKITLSPFWTKKIPEEKGKIAIEVKLAL